MQHDNNLMTRRGLVRAGIAGGAGAAASFVAAPQASAANGIQALIAVTQMKAQTANEEASSALGAAQRQRDLIAKSKVSRETLEGADKQVKQLTALNKSLKELQAKLKELDKAAGDCA